MEEADRQIGSIFDVIRTRDYEEKRHAERMQQQRAAARARVTAHLCEVIEPELRRLATKIEARGIKVELTGKQHARGPELTITLQASGVSSLSFFATRKGIRVYRNAAPRKGEQSALMPFPRGTESTARDVQAALLALLEVSQG